MATALERSLTDRLTVGIDLGCGCCSREPSAASFHLYFVDIAASADNFRADQGPSQAWPAAFGFAVLSATGLVAMRCISWRRRGSVRSTYLSLCNVLHGVSTRP